MLRGGIRRFSRRVRGGLRLDEPSHNWLWQACQMEGPAKETVVIVHGTWASPEAGKGGWYCPGDYTEGFIAKLNTALQKRGSMAQCWAHCHDGNPFFHWSGENSWVARTRAADDLGDHVATLSKHFQKS